MRAARVRVCAGCDRMLPAAELIRVVRVKTNSEDEKKTVYGDDTNVSPTTLSCSSRETENGSRKKKSRTTHVVAVDVSSFLGSEGASTLAASVAPGGAFAAATEEHPDASRAAAALAKTRCRDGETANATENENENASREAFSKASPRKLRLPRRLPGRATYVCRRGVCARRVVRRRRSSGTYESRRVAPTGIEPRSFTTRSSACATWRSVWNRWTPPVGRSRESPGRPRAGRRTPWCST